MDEAIGKILDTGVLGALLILVGSYAIYKDKMLNKEKDARLQDAKETQSKIVEPIENLSKLVKDQADTQRKDNENILDAVKRGK